MKLAEMDDQQACLSNKSNKNTFESVETSLVVLLAGVQALNGCSLGKEDFPAYGKILKCKVSGWFSGLEGETYLSTPQSPHALLINRPNSEPVFFY
jgi:hypothetical protein